MMKALIFNRKPGLLFIRALVLGSLVLVLPACKDPVQDASEKLMEATHPNEVRDLIAQGAEVNWTDGQGRTPLHNAVKYNEKSVVTILLQNGADANIRSKSGNTALHEAAAEGQDELAEVLIGNGADINAQNNLGNTPLHEAAAYDKYLIVECLLQHDAKADLKNKQGKTAYDCAVANHAERTTTYLASIPMTRAMGRILSKCGDKQLIYKLEKFRDGKLKIKEYPFLAHLCRFRGKGKQQDEYLCADEATIRFFIAEGADLNAPLEDGANADMQTPLMTAINAGHWNIVSILLEHNAVCKPQSLDIPLRALLQKGRGAKQISVFLDARKKLAGDLDRYTDGNSLLMDVIMNNETSGAGALLVALLEKGANPNFADKGFVSNANGVPLPLTPVYAAAHKGNDAMVESLKKHGADLNARYGGMSDLCRAAICNDAQVCRILLDNGADTGVEDSYGETPLFWAIHNNNAEIASMLLKSGADPKAKSALYKKPLDKLAKSPEVKKLLLGK